MISQSSQDIPSFIRNPHFPRPGIDLSQTSHHAMTDVDSHPESSARQGKKYRKKYEKSAVKEGKAKISQQKQLRSDRTSTQY
jgi:hypothetical protein